MRKQTQNPVPYLALMGGNIPRFWGGDRKDSRNQ